MPIFRYHVWLVWRSIRRNPWLSAQLIFTIAFGVGAFCATAGALLSLSEDPLGGEGTSLYHPQVDSRRINQTLANATPPDDLTLRDARALFANVPAGRRFMTTRNWLPIVVQSEDHSVARMAITRAATTDFFNLLHAQFLFGTSWSADQDKRAENVVVLSKATNDQIFGGSNSIGKIVTIATKPFVVNRSSKRMGGDATFL
jgi:putative ABC transport system permease protein